MHKVTNLSPLDTKLKIVMLAKFLRLTQGRSSRSYKKVVEEQSNNNELNMAQETTNNPRKDHTVTAENSDGKLTSTTDPAAKSFVSSYVDSCINNIRGSEKK